VDTVRKNPTHYLEAQKAKLATLAKLAAKNAALAAAAKLAEKNRIQRLAELGVRVVYTIID
jgi:hypothetical protein